jgi:hypothetical protein
MTKEEKYLEKIKNDIDERLYDLLTLHLLDVTVKIKTKQEDLVILLDKAIKNLKNNINNYNRLNYYRHILILCNTVLRFRTQRTDLKKLKMEIIDEFTKSETDLTDKIPLNYQINELRLTYDARYLTYLIQSLIKQRKWNKALYCLIAVRLIEPDNEDLDKYYHTIKSQIPYKEIEKSLPLKPYNQRLVIDSNILISMIMYNVDNYKINSNSYKNLEKIKANNTFIITKSVIKEVKTHLDYKLIGIKKACYKNEKLNYTNIKNTLTKRLNSLIKDHAIDNPDPKKYNIIKIEKFYLKYLNQLEVILLEKIKKRYISHKLRKLAQRNSMLPEEGDIELLAEVLELGKDYSILTNDKDFKIFRKQIEKEFGIQIY